MKVTDILLGDDNDLIIRDGDFAVGDSTQQHQKHLLMAEPGDYKQNPLIGIGAQSYLDDEGPGDLLRAMRKELVRDGMIVQNLSVGSDGINIDANY
jgi:hypothetical protein